MVPRQLDAHVQKSTNLLPASHHVQNPLQGTEKINVRAKN